MCGIAGIFDKTGQSAPVGRHLLRMLEALGDRGPDSAGVAVFGPQVGADELILRIKIGESDARLADFSLIEERLRPFARVIARQTMGAYLRLVIELRPEADVGDIAHATEDGPSEEIELVSAGRSLEIVKQVGTPQRLEATYAVSQMNGTHGIGHTRLSTESRIDLSHSQPFWAHGTPDLAIVHNGHITNYHQLRSLYEERGVKFYTHNDSEVIGLYLRDRMARGDCFEEALQASMTELDGSFCYLAASADTLAFVKDSYSFKPLVVAETDEWAAIATEEIALRRALGDDFSAREPAARQIQVWKHAQEAVLA
jgi:glutamate synthase domain-containing protein 1